MDLNRMALSATLHCLAGCAIGEVAGLVIGSAIGLSKGRPWRSPSCSRS